LKIYCTKEIYAQLEALKEFCQENTTIDLWQCMNVSQKHYKDFFFEKETDNLSFSADLIHLINKVNSRDLCDELIDNRAFVVNSINKYINIKKKYLDGSMGKMAQFWMIYMELIELLHLFQYSINLNDFELRKHCWKEIVSLCFSTNKTNYARYGSYYVKILENLGTTHPGAIEELSEKGVSVRRKENSIGQSIE